MASSGITDLVKNIQATIGNLETNMRQIQTDVPTKADLEKVQIFVEENHKGKESNNHYLTSIEKQRRGWEEAREKAEEMSQIFDSLIITNDRPYVSCGLDNNVTEPGFLEFSQFELINKVTFDTDSNQFTLIEPGVYMLQMGGSISGANVVAKMVNDDVEAEVVTLEGTKDTVFRCRSTIFTVEDDDHEAERLLVEVIEQGEDEVVRVEKDFQLVLHKISEVSQAEGPDCLNGDFVKV